MKETVRLKTKQLKIIVISWMWMGFFVTIYDYILLQTGNSAGLSPDYSFLFSIIRNVGAGLIGALIGGSIMVFYVNERFQDKPYAYTIFIVVSSFILIVVLITLLMGIIMVPLKTGKPVHSRDGWSAFLQFLKDPYPLKAAMFWSFIVGITQLLLQVNSKFGQANFWNIIRGKYNKPKEEEKVFMFLDINSSTATAELLGDEKYHSLLKDFFSDITIPILENKGSIYQYVGDEVVVSWKYKDGVENQHCIKCFFDMKTYIEEKKEKYLNKYGLVPSFKAGIHCGKVIAGEIGIIKRDITYSGDVLNTTSRILTKCGEFKEELLASSDLLVALRYTKSFITKPLGAIKLKGKSKEIMLSSILAT